MHVNRTAIGALAFVLITTACAAEPVPSTDDSPQSPGGTEASAERWVQTGGPIVIPRSPFFSDGGMALALQAGRFDEQGIAYRIEEIRSPNEVFPLFLTGELDIWSGGVTSAVLNAIGQTDGVRIVLPVATLDPTACSPVSVVATPSAAESFTGLLQGQTHSDPVPLRIIAEARTLPTAMLRQRLLERLEADSARLELITDVSNAATPAALAGGSADVAIVNEPWKTTTIASGLAVEVLPGTELTPGIIQSVLLIGQRLLDDEELAVRVVAAYLAGVRTFRDGPTEQNVQDLAVITGLEPSLLRSACWPTLSLESRPSEASLTELQEFSVQAGMLDVVLDPDRLWRHDIVDRAQELLDRSAR
jgi:ABC-type nitrate/sulfonate/bicarbonate transport system substrate-binding protein